MNKLFNVDYYKITHHLQYPQASEYIYSYGESRGGDFKFTLFHGLQAFCMEYLQGQFVTQEDIDEAQPFYKEGFGFDYFNREGWEYILKEHGGRLPIEIRAVSEGEIVPTGNVLFTIENTDPKTPWLTQFIETSLLRGVWYPTTVATLSREFKNILQKYATITGCEVSPFGLLDFGARGVSSHESASIGGAAHLINFLGTDTVEGVRHAMRYYKAPVCGFSVFACYDEKTEILTGRGFIPFCDLKDGEKVAQYREDGKIEFVNPNKIHSYDFEGEMISFKSGEGRRYVDFLVTPNHDMVAAKFSRAGQFENILKFKAGEKTASKTGFCQRKRVFVSGESAYRGENFSPMDALRVAFQADGSFVSKNREDKYTGHRGTKPIRFTLKKDRKKKRLESILNNLNIKFTVCEQTNGSRAGYTSYWIPLPNDAHETFVKDFSWVNLETSSFEWCCGFLEELQFWDGSKAKGANVIRFSSTDRSTVEMVQAVASLAKYGAYFSSYTDKRGNRKEIFDVFLTPNKTNVGGTKLEKTKENYKGKVHCVSVDSGMIVVRRNNVVGICGNSEHSTTTIYGKGGELEAFTNFLDSAPDEATISIVIDSYDPENAVKNILGHVLKERILSRKGRTVFRPDSGDVTKVPAEVVGWLKDIFGGKTNDSGFFELNPKISVLQGDGCSIEVAPLILDDLVKNGYASSNVIFGMGGKLLQGVDRDTLKWAIKVSSAVVGGERMDVFKDPVNDQSKASKRGRLKLIKELDLAGNLTYKTINEHHPLYHDFKDELVTVFKNGELLVDHNFQEIRDRASKYDLNK